MESFNPYVRELEQLASQALHSGSLAPPVQERAAAALDGQTTEMLRSLVPLPVRRRAGAFFTGMALAKLALEPISAKISSASKAFDPACGVGDLLIAYARHLPLERDLLETVQAWGEQLHGSDVHPEFVRAAKARLTLFAAIRGASGSRNRQPSVHETFPHVSVGDGLSIAGPDTGSIHVLLNPPYAKIAIPPECEWGSGKLSAAALFIDHWLSTSRPGAHVTAILPDVLRTGSLYGKWRANVESRAKIELVQVVGAFDDKADVDVFVLQLTVGSSDCKQSVSWWRTSAETARSHVGDRFRVYVGPVVPHRHADDGDRYPYLHAKLMPPWQTIDAQDTERRRFQGRTFTPPFVAVRRTSSPHDRHRAIATVVDGRLPVAVENHLLVLEPRDGTLETCQALLKMLHDERTTSWLNDRIRCRHLTVGALSEVPWWDRKDDR
jgi:hypothetical protein